MRILFVCGREPEYTRNQIVLKALRRHAEVLEITDSSKNYIITHLKLLFKIVTNTRPYDVIFVGFYGYLLVFLMRLVSRKPIIFDAYLSTYNTLCFDRKRFRPDSLLGRIVYWMDRLACRFADVVLLDTRAHLDYFVRIYALPPERCAVLYVGSDEEIFHPRKPPRDGPFTVFYYGSFLPLQGIEYIVRAARIIQDRQPGIIFQIAGNGIQYQEIRTLAQQLKCKTIEFIPWIPYEQLPNYIARAWLCLGGHFADSDKAQNVISTKTYQFLAMARPTIVGDCRANAEIFHHGEHVYMVKMADAQALAEAILLLYLNDELRQRIADGGFIRFSEHYSVERLSTVLCEIVGQVYAALPHHS